MAPLFILWALRGSSIVKDVYFIPACLGLAILPSLVLLRREEIAKSNKDVRTITVGKAEDNRDHILVYLFAMLLPFYTVNMGDIREFVATIAALLIIIFLFWHLNMHYMNLIFAIRGYRVFTILPPSQKENPYTGQRPFVLLTKRSTIADDTTIQTYRLSDTVFIEKEEAMQ
jgi:hypothetical protein